MLREEEATDAAMTRAKLYSQMLAACRACQALYEANELEENLEPIWKLPFPEYTDQETGAEFVVADGGLGWDGSVKRKRAYNRKVMYQLVNKSITITKYTHPCICLSIKYI